MAKAEMISKKFYDLDKTKKFPYRTKQLFELLINIYKEKGELDQLELSTGELCQKLNSSEKGFIDARKTLEENGIITYENCGTRSPGIYKFTEVNKVTNLSNSFDTNERRSTPSYDMNPLYEMGIIAPSSGYYNTNNKSNYSNQSNQYDFNFDFLKKVNREQLLAATPLFIIGGTVVYQLSRKNIDISEFAKAITISGIISCMIIGVIYVFWPKEESSQPLNQQKVDQSPNSADQQVKPVPAPESEQELLEKRLSQIHDIGELSEEVMKILNQP